MPKAHGRTARGTGDHEEELAELQRRFNALADARRSTEANPALLTKDLSRTEVATEKKVRNDPAVQSELARLDEQIVELRRKHDRLHDSNHRKRLELDALADKLKDLHNSSYKADASPQDRLRGMEEKLVGCAQRYEEEHRIKMTYEQVIRRLKQERLGFPAELKALESTLAQKESEYEQLLLMSHDANHSKEVAKQELSKFEMIVTEERKLREKELQSRRQLLHKKQQLATELEKNEKERRAALHEPNSRLGEESAKAQAEQTQRLIAAEQQKIAAYEAAFQQIKEATAVADVNEVIQKFLSQEETHQNLLAMTRDSQSRIDVLREAMEREKSQVEQLQYALVESEERDAERRPQRDPEHPERDLSTAARQALERGRARWRRIWRTQVNCKAAVQHVIDALEPLRLEDELLTPLTDESMLEHMQQIEKKLTRIASAFLEEQQRRAPLMSQPQDVLAKELAQQPPGSPLASMGTWPRAAANGDSGSEEEFEEDMEEDVIDRESLKKASGAILDKRSKKTKKKKKRAMNDDEGSKAMGSLA